MKTKILALLILSLLLFSCQEGDSDFLEKDTINALLEKSSDKEVFVTVPFKTNLSVWDRSDYADNRCGNAPIFYLTMEGNGNITHMGNSTTVFNFCVDTSDGSYWDTVVTFVAANGDELYAEIPVGQIIPNDEINSDYYQTKFNDPMYFVGGTGRFEDASGEAMTHAYVHNDLPIEWRTDLFSEGFLILKKGNSK